MVLNLSRENFPFKFELNFFSESLHSSTKQQEFRKASNFLLPSQIFSAKSTKWEKTSNYTSQMAPRLLAHSSLYIHTTNMHGIGYMHYLSSDFVLNWFFHACVAKFWSYFQYFSYILVSNLSKVVQWSNEI